MNEIKLNKNKEQVFKGVIKSEKVLEINKQMYGTILDYIDSLEDICDKADLTGYGDIKDILEDAKDTFQTYFPEYLVTNKFFIYNIDYNLNGINRDNYNLTGIKFDIRLDVDSENYLNMLQNSIWNFSETTDKNYLILLDIGEEELVGMSYTAEITLDIILK